MFFAKSLQVFSKLFFSSLFGILVAIFVFKHDPQIKKEIGRWLQPFCCELLTSDVSFDLEAINFFPLELKLKNVHTFSKEDPSWSWDCDAFTVQCSWIDLLLYGTVSLKLYMDGLKGKTDLGDDGLTIWKHIAQLYEGEIIVPVFLQRLKIKNASLKIVEPYSDSVVDTKFALDLGTIGNALKGTIYFDDARLAVKQFTFLEDLRGPVRFDVLGAADSFKLMIKPRCTLCVPQMGDKKNCSLSGLWKYDHGLFSIKNDDRSFLIGPIKMYLVGSTVFSELVGRFPASCLYAPLRGDCTVKLNVDFDDGISCVRGELMTGPIWYGKKLVSSANKISCKRENETWTGGLFCSLQNAKNFFGTYRWDEATQSGCMQLKNRSELKLFETSFWSVLPQQFCAQLAYKNETVTGDWSCKLKNETLDEELASDGTFSLQEHIFAADGTIADKTVSATGHLKPTFSLQECRCCGSDGSQLLALTSDEKKQHLFSGEVDFSFVRELLAKTTGVQLSGEGIFSVQGGYKDKNFVGTVRLKDGNIRIARTYNFLRELYGKFSFDSSENMLIAKNVICLLHKGKLKIPRVVMHFDDTMQPQFFHVPILFHDCLLNWKKDLFCTASGAVTLKKDNEAAPMVAGSVFLERSQLRQNIFSTDFQKELFGPGQTVGKNPFENVLFDLQVKTKRPVAVQTSFLQTSVSIDLGLTGSVARPDLSGVISLSSGSLLFPYKPLLLTKGQIDFVTGNIDEPLIEITARNKIKKYNIGLHVAGTAQEQQITLESSPPLSEEQILSLLLAGSEHESLNILMPALIMQNVKGIIFGSDQSPSGVRSAFGRLLKPFERIHLVPSFTDQTGRGGLRGAIEIDISERWRAMIQKNFSQTEDTKFEAEYLLSDDISVKAARDERGDIGAELQMRWKF